MANEEWQLIHDYFRYVRWGMLEGILCPNDGYVLKYRANKSLDPVLICYLCSSVFTPGLSILDEMRKEVDKCKKRQN